MNNPETLVTLGTRHGSQKWTIQRHWQNWAQDTEWSRTKQQQQKTTQKTKKISNTDPIKKPLTC